MLTLRLRAFFSFIVLTSVALAVGLAISEALVRVIAPQVTFFPRYLESAEYEIELPPNSALKNARGRLWSFTYTTNELGRRGRYFSPERRDSACAVVVLGDSFTFGIGVPDGTEYASVLGARLSPTHVVINGGMSGWGLDSEIKWYYKTGRQYKPAFVVLQFTANDPYDYRGLTTIDDGQFRFHPYTLRKPKWQVWVSRSRILQNSHLYILARRAYDARSLKSEGGVAGDNADVLAVQQRYVALLDAFAGALREDDVALVFTSVTHHEPGNGVYLYDTERFPLIHKRVKELASQGMLRFSDLPLSAMAPEAGSPEGHQWGVVHHRMAGERIAEIIGAEGCSNGK